jgi:hypothetical protein
MNLFGAGYQTTYSLIGYTNLKMAKWCSYYRAILRSINDNDENKSIYKKVSSLISESFMFHLETNYYNEIALGYFRKAIEMHTGGAAYAQNSKNLYYSEDDLSDNFIHFLSALERFRINSDSLEEEIKKLKQKLSKSKVYKTETYGFMGDETNSQDYDPVE